MFRLTPASPAVQGRTAVPGGGAPAAATSRVSAIGDSWTACNEAILARSGAGSPTPSDDWTLQLAGALGFAHSTAPGENGVTSGVVVRCGYANQKTGPIKDNWLALTAADPARKGDIKLLWPGRGDVADANGEGAVIAGVDAIIADSANDLITLAMPYAGTGISAGSAHANLVRQQKIARNYWRTKRRFVHPLNLDFMGLDDSDGSDAQAVQVAGMQAPTLMLQSAAADQTHPNHLAQPKIAAALEPLVKAMLHRGVFVRRQQICDVPFDLAAGAKIEVYLEGHVTGVAITADDPVQPGLFTIAMKAGSNKVAELSRTAVDPGAMKRILYLGITATGLDRGGNAVSHSQTIRIKPSAVGAASTLPIGAELVRDPHPTLASRRAPMMIGSASPWADGPVFTFVMNGHFLEDDLVNQIFEIDGLSVLIQRNASERLSARVEDSSGSTAMSWVSTGPLFNVANGPFWLAFSCDLGAGGAAHMWAWTAATGDVDVKPATPAITVGTGLIKLSNQPSWCSLGSAAEMRARVRREWIDNRFLDFSQAANRRKFWNADGSPVDLGAEGRVDGVRPAYDLFTGTPGDYLDGFNRGHAEAPAVSDTWGLGLATNLDPLPF
jgi:hypothetical protein